MADVYLERVESGDGARSAGDQWSARTIFDSLTAPSTSVADELASAMQNARERAAEEARAPPLSTSVSARPASPQEDTHPHVATPPPAPEATPPKDPPQARVKIEGERLRGRPADTSHVASMVPSNEKLPPLEWNADSPLNVQPGFEDAMRRINRYIYVMNRGTEAEDAFDPNSSDETVITEDLILTSDIMRPRHDMASPLGASAERWKKALTMRSKRGREMYRWIAHIIDCYNLLPELKQIDFVAMFHELQDKDGVDRISDMHFHRVSGIPHPDLARNPAEAQSIAYKMIAERNPHAIPYARLSIHHTTANVIRYYALRATIRFTFSEASVPAEEPPKDTWREVLCQIVVGDDKDVTEHAYFQTPQPNPDGILRMREPPPTTWKERASILVPSASYESYNGQECVFFRDAQKDHYRIVRVSDTAQNAKVCAEVLLHASVPVWRRKLLYSLETSYVSLPGDRCATIAGTSDGKITPFNCDDPTCIGIHSHASRCIDMPIRATEWYDPVKRVVMDVSTARMHTLAVQFVWGLSRVEADVQIHAHDSPARATTGVHIVNRLMCDSATFIYVMNARFVCDISTMRMALSELLEYERNREQDKERAERYRSAAVFVRRSK